MNKNTYILGGLLIVLVLLALLVLQKPGEQSSGDASKVIFKIDSSAIDKIELKTPALSITLEKRGAEWFVTQPIAYKASHENVAQMLSQVKAMESKGLITNKPEKFAAFEVNNAGTQVRISAKGTEQAAFVLGKMGSTYLEMYARTLSSNDVLLVTGVFGFTFNRPLKEWRDKTIFKTAHESINEIAYRYGDTTFVLSLNNGEWFIGGAKAKKSAVEDIIGQLSNLRCSDFVDTDVTPAPKTIAIISYANVQVQLAFDKPSGKYFVQASNSPQRYVMEPWQANQVLKRKRELLDSEKK
jgi:hypothetical protein